MATHVGKKFVLLSPEVYESLMNKSNNKKYLLAPPEKTAIWDADSNLKNIWDRKDIPEDEKVRQFTEELNSLKRYRETLLKPKPININVKNEELNNMKEPEILTDNNDDTEIKEVKATNSSNIDDVLTVLPKTLRKDAGQILRFIKSTPEKLTWNTDKEIVYQGSVLHGSNIADLLMDTLSNRKKMISPTLFRNTFSKGLNDINAPKEWIKNPNMKTLMDVQNKENILPNRKRSRSVPYPVNLNKNIVKSGTPSKWLSSTSRIR